MTDCAPPFGMTVVLLVPDDESPDFPDFYIAEVSHCGEVKISLPWSAWEDFTRRENKDHMLSLLSKCTHWAFPINVIELPEKP
jgi:hypothetical protein